MSTHIVYQMSTKVRAEPIVAQGVWRGSFFVDFLLSTKCLPIKLFDSILVRYLLILMEYATIC